MEFFWRFFILIVTQEEVESAFYGKLFMLCSMMLSVESAVRTMLVILPA